MSSINYFIPKDYDPIDGSNESDMVDCDCKKCDKDTCNAPEQMKLPIVKVSKAPKFGKCPKCLYGDMIADFGPVRHCTLCGYEGK